MRLLDNFRIILLVITIAGCLWIPRWSKQGMRKHWLFYEIIWLFLALMAYVVIVEVIYGSFYFLIPLVFLAIFLASYKREKRRLANGILFNLFLFASLLYLAYVLFNTLDSFLVVLAIAAALVLFVFLLFGFIALLMFLYTNAYIVYRREGFSLANMLTLLLALGLTIFAIVDAFTLQWLPSWVTVLLQIIPAWLIYLGLVFYNFLTISLIYQFNQPSLDQDYVIVLGAGLLEGHKVSRLLGNRIDKGIEFYHYQKEVNGHPIKLVMSGGQGEDELLSEAEAMRDYALDQGIPAEDILVETESTTTLENMQFSKELLGARHGDSDFKAIFTTNNYHLFRAALFAKESGLDSQGIGADTKFYFVPNAFLREFVAILVMNKRRHIVMMGLIAAGVVLLALLLLFASNYIVM